MNMNVMELTFAGVWRMTMAKQFKTMEELERAMLKVMDAMQEHLGFDETEADCVFGHIESEIHEMCGSPDYSNYN